MNGCSFFATLAIITPKNEESTRKKKKNIIIICIVIKLHKANQKKKQAVDRHINIKYFIHYKLVEKKSEQRVSHAIGSVSTGFYIQQ